MKWTVIFGICAVVFAALLFGCGGGGGSAKTGTLKLAITDKPSDDYGKLIIAIREVRVVPEGRENAKDDDPGLPVVAHYDAPKVVDVMKLQFVQQALGEVVLPAGKYSQIRLILEPNPNGQGQPPVNYLTLKSDTTSTPIPLDTPSGVTSGLKILGPLTVKPGVINAVTIDFDPNTAVVSKGDGGYAFKPTGIRIVETSAELAGYGSIGGTVISNLRAWSSATVSVKRRGTINDSEPIAAGTVFSTYTGGRWEAPFTAFVPPSGQDGSYKTFITAEGFQPYSSPSVPVLQGQMTDLGEISLTPAQ